MAISPLLVLGGVGLVALAATGKKKPRAPGPPDRPVQPPPQPGGMTQAQKQQCIDDWAAHLDADFLATPDADYWEFMGGMFQDWSWDLSAACLREGAGRMRSGGAPESCFDALRADVGGETDPEVLFSMAESARSEGRPDIGQCMDEMRTGGATFSGHRYHHTPARGGARYPGGR